MMDAMSGEDRPSGSSVVTTDERDACRLYEASIEAAVSHGDGLRPVDAGDAHHIVGHLHFDLVKEPGRRRIERIVEIEDPGMRAAKLRMWHGFAAFPG